MHFLLDKWDLGVYNTRMISIETEGKLICNGSRNWQTGLSEEVESESFFVKAQMVSHHYIWKGITYSY